MIYKDKTVKLWLASLTKKMIKKGLKNTFFKFVTYSTK